MSAPWQASPIHQQRLELFRRAGIYLVTSAEVSAGRSTLAIVRAALAGGIRLIQLREKSMPLPALFKLALQVRRLTRAAAALCLINDRVDLALAVDADGVHLGQSDLPLAAARRLAPDLIIGASTHSLSQARRAQAAGASYVNIGPIFPTQTKAGHGACIGLAGLRAIAPKAPEPFSVMGGIKLEHLPELWQAGARTVAVVSAISAAADPQAAATELLRRWRQLGARR